MKVLVTGAAGFIGHHVCARLAGSQLFHRAVKLFRVPSVRESFAYRNHHPEVVWYPFTC